MIPAVILPVACSSTVKTGSAHVGTVTNGPVQVKPRVAPDQQAATPNPAQPLVCDRCNNPGSGKLDPL